MPPKGTFKQFCTRGHDRTVTGVYGSTCKKCVNERTARYQKEHRAEYAAYCRAYARRQKEAVIAAYGGVCACCGTTNPEFLSIDHVNGGGTARRRAGLEGGGSMLYAKLRREGYPQEGYRLLCFNCNSSFGLYGYCPHQNELDHSKKEISVEKEVVRLCRT